MREVAEEKAKQKADNRSLSLVRERMNPGDRAISLAEIKESRYN
jgi:hypothetical protein